MFFMLDNSNIRLGLKYKLCLKTNGIVKIQTFFLCKIYIGNSSQEKLYVGEIYTCNTTFIENTFSYKREREKSMKIENPQE